MLQRLMEAETAAASCKDRLEKLEEATQAAGCRTIEQVCSSFINELARW